jgi:polysaccharide biosynthesis protein PslH
MKILWVKSDFLHPTTKGGQIRTLEMLRRLHRQHEIHYVAFASDAEGPAQSGEYCSRAVPVPMTAPAHSSLRFYAQVAAGLFSSLPVAITRYRSEAMAQAITRLRATEDYEALVSDFLFPAVNIPDMERFILFQHNVETTIWERHCEHARDPLRRAYLKLQADRMRAYEAEVCRSARHVVAVSPVDAALMRERFGVTRISDVATGVNLEYFQPGSPPAAHTADLVFVGSMDWLPNIQAVTWFLEEVWPLILSKRPDCTVAIVGRKPPEKITAFARELSGVHITGTVPDVRPYLWGSSASIVPIHIGGGTRLKIYESMAAKVPVVSTHVGAEGLAVEDGANILFADTAAEFAGRCLHLLSDPALGRRLSENAWEMVATRFSWDRIADEFLGILEAAREPAHFETPA